MDAQDQDLVAQGQINFGRYKAPFRTVNPLEAQPFSRALPRALRDLRLKEWQAFQFANQRVFVNVALFNAKLMALVQVKVYDRQTGTKHLFERRVPPWRFRAPTQLLDSQMSYDRRGCRVHFRNRLAQDLVDIEIDIAATRTCPAIRGALQGLYAGQEPLVVAIPFGPNRGMYSHKGIVPVQGSLSVGDLHTDFAPGNGYLLMDDHRGYYPYVMRWDWITGGRWLEDGRLFGFTLTHNDSIDPSRFNENALWVDGVAHALPPIRFQRVTRGQEIWHIRDQEGRVRVDFKVEVPGRVALNLGVVRSRYRGPFGTCTGQLVDTDGTAWSVDGLFGMAEDFYLRV